MNLLRDGQRVLVAVSGGLDSMALLHVLHELASKHRWHLTVAHFNHQLRGKSSEAEETFVQRAAARVGLPFVSDRADVRAEAKRSGVSVEMAARKLRHAFFAAAARKLKTQAIALAHHADDQVELFFLRLLRGAGSQGLAGMNWSNASFADARVRLIRPLLDESKDSLAAFVRERKIRFREDATNASRDILRNRVRHELLALLRKGYQPSLNEIVLRNMQLLRDEAEFMTGEAMRWSVRRKPEFSDLPVALQRRVLQSEFARHGLAVDFALIERLRLHPGEWFMVRPALRCRRTISGDVEVENIEAASFQPDELAIDLQRAARRETFCGLQIRWHVARSSALPRSVRQRKLSQMSGREFFDADKVGSAILLRHWRAGDRFQPIGMTAAVKLQDLFVNQKIPKQRRHALVIATTAAGEIFWVEGCVSASSSD
jgi:tRNA(Ile)-lysidine synthase